MRPTLVLASILVAVLALHGRRARPFATIVAGDQPQYLALADAAPDLRFYDRRPYVLHPPLYPWAIHAAARVTGGTSSGGAAVLGVASVLVAAGAAFGLARVLGAGPGGGALAATAVGASSVLEAASADALREPWTAALLAAAAFLLAASERHSGVKKRLLEATALTALAALGLSWDGALLLVPGLLPRPRAALALLVPWLAWAAWRASVLLAEPDYPAGISGLIEVPREHLLGLVNPNLLPRTREHNGFYWPLAWTPAFAARALELVAGGVAAVLALAALAIPGAVAARARGAWLAGTVLLLLAPTFAGQQPRYGTWALPLLAALAGRGASSLAPRRLARAGAAAAVLVALGAAGVAFATRPWSAFRRETFVAARSIAPLVARTEGAVATTVDLTPEVTWHLRDRRVLTLPKAPADVAPFVSARGVGAVVAPVPAHPAWLDSDHPEVRRACSLDALEVTTRSATRFGLTIEADPDLRARVYRVLDLRASDSSEPWPFVTFEERSIPWLLVLARRGAFADDAGSRQALKVLATEHARDELRRIARDSPDELVRQAAAELAGL